MSDSNKSKETKLIYEGSVKRLYQSPTDNESLWFEFTDDYSIFDWGKMPDTVANKGKALTFLGAYFFEVFSEPKFWSSLKESKHLKRFGGDWLKRRFTHTVFENLLPNGMPHHFKRLSDGKKSIERNTVESASPLFMEVIKAEVLNPECRKILNHALYFYPHLLDAKEREYQRRLIPLEVVFRFGMPEGSSLTSRLKKNPAYLKELGLPATPTPGEWFPVPVIEFFTKLEPSDRLLSWSEASVISGLGADAFQSMCEMTLAASLGLYHIFAERGLELWDGKFEFIVDYSDCSAPQVMLADSIGPDELRLIYHGHHFSKEMIRQIYRDSSWAQALGKAKDMAKQQAGSDFKQICIEELKQTPSPLSPAEKEIVDSLYGTLVNHIANFEVFPKQPGIDQFVANLDETLSKSSSGWHAASSDSQHPRRRGQSAKASIHQEKEISIKPRGDIR